MSQWNLLCRVLSLFCRGFVSCCRGFGCFAVSWVCSAITTGCLAVALCFVDVSFVVAVTPVEHRSMGLRTKINKAPGIPSNWSTVWGSAMLFLPESKLRKYGNINIIVWFIWISGSQGAFKVPLQNSGAPGPRTKINRALGIPSNWSRDPGSAVLFCFILELRKGSNFYSLNAVFVRFPPHYSCFAVMKSYISIKLNGCV